MLFCYSMIFSFSQNYPEPEVWDHVFRHKYMTSREIALLFSEMIFVLDHPLRLSFHFLTHEMETSAFIQTHRQQRHIYRNNLFTLSLKSKDLYMKLPQSPSLHNNLCNIRGSDGPILPLALKKRLYLNFNLVLIRRPVHLKVALLDWPTIWSKNLKPRRQTLMALNSGDNSPLKQHLQSLMSICSIGLHCNMFSIDPVIIIRFVSTFCVCTCLTQCYCLTTGNRCSASHRTDPCWHRFASFKSLVSFFFFLLFFSSSNDPNLNFKFSQICFRHKGRRLPIILFKYLTAGTRFNVVRSYTWGVRVRVRVRGRKG